MIPLPLHRRRLPGPVLLLGVGLTLGGAGAPGCAPDDPPPACQMDLVAHVDPLPPPSSPFEYRYSEVAARAGIAYLGASRGAGVQVIDVAEARAIGALDAGLAATINSVAVEGSLLVFAAGAAGIVAYDISDPRQPARRAHTREPISYCHTVFVHRDLVSCATSSEQEPHVAFFQVTRPDDPAAPLAISALGSYSAPLTPEETNSGAEILVHDLFVHERDGRTLAYLAYWERGLQVIDVTDPARPRLVGASAPTPRRWTHSVWVDGDFAYVGEESYKGAVRVFDVSDPARPHEVGELRSSQGDAISAHNVQVAGGVVYASWYQDGLRAFAAQGAAAPSEIGYFHTWSGADNRRNPGPFDVRFAGSWDVFVDGGAIHVSDMQTGLWVLRHQPGAGVCPPDRPRGTSAFAKVGRPPFGWTALLPRRLRPDRTVSMQGRLSSVDPYFAVTDEVAGSLRPRVQLLGGLMLGPSELQPSPSARPVASRVVSGRAQVPALAAPGGLALVATLDDEGTERSLTLPLQVLPVAPANRDLEPNEDQWVSGVLQLDPAGRATLEGSFEGGDRRDLYVLEAPAGPARRFRLVTGTAAVEGEPGQPTARLIVSRSASLQPDFGDPLVQAGPDTWDQLVTVPPGEPGSIFVSVDAVRPGASTPTPYTLEISGP
jgi:hypothetical protein